MLKPVSESLKLVQSRLGEMEKERVGAYGPENANPLHPFRE